MDSSRRNSIVQYETDAERTMAAYLRKHRLAGPEQPQAEPQAAKGNTGRRGQPHLSQAAHPRRSMRKCTFRRSPASE